MPDTEPTLTAPETAATPQPASSVETTPSTPAKKPLSEMASWDEYTASIQPAPADAEPGGEPAAEPAEPVADEPQPDAFDQYTLDDKGRLHRPDGTFADEQEIAAYNATIPEPAEPEAAEPEPEAPAVHTVELRTRDGSTRTIEVDDPDLADLLRTNANDGMRASQYRERVAKVDAQLAELNAFKTMLETNPDAVIFDALPEEKRASLAVKLVAQYWDTIYPQLVAFEQNDAERVRAAMQVQVDLRTQQDAYQRALTSQQQASQIAAATSALIPDTVDDAVAERFLADAEHDLLRAAQAGQALTPESVPQILAPRLALYGFTNGSTSTNAGPVAPKAAVRFTASSPAVPPAVPTAAPVGEKAAQLAEQARETQARIRSQRQQRQRAAAVPPAGAGAAPVRVPVVPKGASIEDVSKVLKQHKSWASFTG